MKDYHDLLFLCESDLLDLDKTRKQVNVTFVHRETKKVLPISFSEKDFNKLQEHWQRHLAGLSSEVSAKLPTSIIEVTTLINTLLKKANIN